MAKEKIQATGCCHYCGSVRFVNATEEKTQEQLDLLATKECDCEKAKFERNKETQRERAITNIKLLISAEKCPKVTEGLSAVVPFIQDFVFTEVTVKLDDVSKVKMSMNDKGSIVISKTDTIKDTIGD